MSSFIHRESAALLIKRRTAWRTPWRRAIERLRAHCVRQRQRQELLDYIASDYRAARDIGISTGEARGWSQCPFWRN